MSPYKLNCVFVVYHFCGWNNTTHAVANFVSEIRWQLGIDDAELSSDFWHKSIDMDTPSLNLQVLKKIHSGSWPSTQCNEVLPRPLVLLCEFCDIYCQHVRKKFTVLTWGSIVIFGQLCRSWWGTPLRTCRISGRWLRPILHSVRHGSMHLIRNYQNWRRPAWFR